MPDLNIFSLIKNMQPQLHKGTYVFCTVPEIGIEILQNCIMIFKEEEGFTLILDKQYADKVAIQYQYVAAWITLKVNSSLEATGFTAAFSVALSDKGISCNVVAAYHHDHIFVALNDGEKAMNALKNLSNKFK
jgi:uncharacterized protein